MNHNHHRGHTHTHTQNTWVKQWTGKRVSGECVTSHRKIVSSGSSLLFKFNRKYFSLSVRKRVSRVHAIIVTESVQVNAEEIEIESREAKAKNCPMRTRQKEERERERERERESKSYRQTGRNFLSGLKGCRANWTTQVTQSVNQVMHKTGQKWAFTCSSPSPSALDWVSCEKVPGICTQHTHIHIHSHSLTYTEENWVVHLCRMWKRMPGQNRTEFMVHVLISSLICSLKRRPCTSRFALFHHFPRPVWMLSFSFFLSLSLSLTHSLTHSPHTALYIRIPSHSLNFFSVGQH